MRLCKVAACEERVMLWNNNWLKPIMMDNMPLASVVDVEVLKKLTPVITFRETRTYNYDIDYPSVGL